jgi:integrase
MANRRVRVVRSVIDGKGKEGLSERTVFTRGIAVMSILKFHGIRGLTKRGDTPRYVENEPEAYTTEELDALFAASKPEYRMLFTFYLRTGFRMQEIMYLEYRDVDFKHRTVSVTSKSEYGFRPNRRTRNLLTIQNDGRTNRALKVIQCAQTAVFATYTMRCSEEMRWPL